MQKLLTILKSAAVGGIATAVDLLVLALFVEVFGIDVRLASIPALALGVVFQFLGNKLFAFEDRSTDLRALAKQGALFAAVEAGALFLNALLFHLAMTANVVPYLIARVLVQALVYFAFSLPLWSRIFQQRSPV
jgi:putative flippase GtrA